MRCPYYTNSKLKSLNNCKCTLFVPSDLFFPPDSVYLGSDYRDFFAILYRLMKGYAIIKLACAVFSPSPKLRSCPSLSFGDSRQRQKMSVQGSQVLRLRSSSPFLYQGVRQYSLLKDRRGFKMAAHRSSSMINEANKCEMLINYIPWLFYC